MIAERIEEVGQVRAVAARGGLLRGQGVALVRYVPQRERLGPMGSRQATP